ncbi:MAG: phenylalanine--tRNA ligase subunit beta [Elusimicrobia bacterium]|nr:phenylalanine--tRNA ligase subunit beta [Elusimicrobiota bacterium]
MKISYNWLKEHIDPGISATDLAPHLLQLGFEVSSLERRGPAFSGVVTAQILEIGKHPNADRLSLCTVTDGSRKLSIVCGAKNIAVGQKVPLAVIGAKLPGGREITPAKIRGVESQGMICSASELGLPGENGGILVLSPETAVGADFSKAQSGGDDIMEVEITPNRPDCLSHLGLARELSALFRIPLKERPAPKVDASGDCWPVELEAKDACPRYLGRVLTGLQVGPSPGWLAAKLEAVGLRSINNVVDVTNFALMDIGQPMHAFDLDKLEGGKIIVRFARKEETIRALDEKEYKLTPEVLVIADAKSPQAIAGVMGGLASAVGAKTTKAFLESAHFAPPAIRKSSSLLRLRSDSSYRFERGTDLAAVSTASRRAAELILSVCGKQARSSGERDAGQSAPEKIVIHTTVSRLNAILGADFAKAEAAETLKRLSAACETKGDDIAFTAPSWRGDLASPWDLAEELARLFGYDNVPAKASAVAARPSRITPGQTLADKLRARLAGFGFHEAYNYDFVSDRLLERCGLKGDWARLANPISEDWTILRPSLLPGLLQNAAFNLNRGASSARLFELGKVYAKTEAGVEERTQLAGLVLGPAGEPFWRGPEPARGAIYEALGAASGLLEGVPGLSWTEGAGRDPFFGAVGWRQVASAKGALGAVGKIQRPVARAFDLEREDACLFFLDLDRLCEAAAAARRFSPYSQFPSVTRDLSVLLDAKTPYASVLAALPKPGELSRETALIDLFTGKGVPPGKKSLTLRFTFSRMDRTLRDDEIASAMEGILATLKNKLGAVLRS